MTDDSVAVCASRPWLILFLGFLLIVALGHGIKYMQVTTDPVELWASPHSRSRVEREYFDKHFEPFYRNEQIIITSVGLPKVCTNEICLKKIYIYYIFAQNDLYRFILPCIFPSKGKLLYNYCLS